MPAWPKRQQFGAVAGHCEEALQSETPPANVQTGAGTHVAWPAIRLRQQTSPLAQTDASRQLMLGPVGQGVEAGIHVGMPLPKQQAWTPGTQAV
jgi:hypothetical protein